MIKDILKLDCSVVVTCQSKDGMVCYRIRNLEFHEYGVTGDYERSQDEGKTWTHPLRPKKTGTLRGDFGYGEYQNWKQIIQPEACIKIEASGSEFLVKPSELTEDSVFGEYLRRDANTDNEWKNCGEGQFLCDSAYLKLKGFEPWPE